MRHWFFLISAIWSAAFGVYSTFCAQTAKSSFKEVPEKERPGWSYMPLWYYRALGLVVLAVSGLFFYLFATGR
jgi:hypothetical protein